MHQIGWPKYSPSTKHVLKISTFADQNLQYDNAIFTAIFHEHKEENCAFWNQLLPALKQLSDIDTTISAIARTCHHLFELSQ